MNVLGVLLNDDGVLPYPDIGPWQIGPLPEIHAFGVVLAIGLLVGVIAAGYRGARTMGVSEERVHNFGIWIIFVGFVVSHIIAVITYEPGAVADFLRDLPHDPATAFDHWPVGMISSLGGVVGGGLAAMIWMNRNPDQDALAWANLSAWTLAICFFFGRLGCTLAYDHPGKEAGETGVWTWVYEQTGGAVPEVFPLMMDVPAHFEAYLGTAPRHNLGFYEAILWFGILVLFVVLSRKPRRRGLYLWLLPLLYSPFRFVLDFLREHPEAVEFGGDARYLGLTPAQYMSVLFFFLGLWGWYKLKDEPVEEWEEYEHDPDEDTEVSDQ